MNRQRRFRPSETWALEDRVALSHGGAVAEVAAASVRAQAQTLGLTFVGNFATKTVHGIDTANSTAYLVGAARVAGLGNVNLQGFAQDNIVFPSFRSPTQGTLVVATTAGGGGILTIQLSGPFADLAPGTGKTSTTKLTAKVVSATGVFAPEAHVTGTATLLLRTTGSSQGGLMTPTTTVGKFTLVLAAS
jgi:hypothetical protein